jgi:hypothetical protein
MAIVINGSGTVTGLSVGGLPDGTVDAGTVAADVATQAELDAKTDATKVPLAGGTMTGNLTVGSVTDPTISLLSNANDNATSGRLKFREGDGVNGFDIRYNGSANQAVIDTTDVSNAIVIARTTGTVGIGTTDTSLVDGLKVVSDSTSLWSMFVASNPTSNHGRCIRMNLLTDFDNNSSAFLYGSGGGTGGAEVTRFVVYSDGDVYNHDNTYGSTSDERIKQDIVDASSQWADIKALKVRNFKRKDDVRKYGSEAETQIGLIAQEVETVSPNLVKLKDPNKNDIASDSAFGRLYTSDDSETQGDNPTASVGDVKVAEQVKQMKYSVLYMKAVKALQEAMDRIETLETKVTALEA